MELIEKWDENHAKKRRNVPRKNDKIGKACVFVSCAG
jgi:hypothetical protein